MMFRTASFRLWPLLVLLLTATSAAQETFDLVTYQAPPGWHKQSYPHAVSFSKEDKASGKYALITILRALPAGGDSRYNFQTVWQSAVAELVGSAGSPEMQPSRTKDGWQIETGTAVVKGEGGPSVALLTAATGQNKVVSVVILTNATDYQDELEQFIASLKLPPVKAETVANSSRPTSTAAQPKTSRFKYSTTNFDNGWTSVEESAWVRASKGHITALLHYPHPKEKETFFELETEARTFWDLLVAPRYSQLQDFEVLRSDRDFEPARYAAGTVTDNATGASVFVALFSKHGSGWLEVIAPNKAAFEREFGAIRVNDEFIDWKPLLSLFSYNRFAVGPGDLTGTWSSKFAGTTHYANLYTGRYVGASTTVTAESYTFGKDGTYRWRTDGATSAAGRTDFSKAESSGRYSLATEWKLHLSDIEGRPQTYDVYFSCVRNARVLWVQGKAFGQID